MLRAMSRRQSRRIKKRHVPIKKDTVIAMPVNVAKSQESAILLPPPVQEMPIQPMKNKVFIVGGDSAISAMFRARNFLIVKDALNADILCFTGGADVDPSLYGEPDHPTTQKNVRRDTVEKEVYNWGLSNGKFMVGICRGGQFLNVMNGGEMWQHVDNHATLKGHKAWLSDYSDEFEVTSTHHQMMRPKLDECEVLLIAYEASFKEGMTPMGGKEKIKPEDHLDNDLLGVDHEAVFYRKTGSLCFQPHPEYGSASNDCVEYFFRFIDAGIQDYEEYKKQMKKVG